MVDPVTCWLVAGPDWWQSHGLKPPWAHPGFSLCLWWKAWGRIKGKAVCVGTCTFEWMEESSLTLHPSRALCVVPKRWAFVSLDSACLKAQCSVWVGTCFVKSISLIASSCIWRCCPSNERNAGVLGLYKGMQALATEKYASLWPAKTWPRPWSCQCWVWGVELACLWWFAMH